MDPSMRRLIVYLSCVSVSLSAIFARMSDTSAVGLVFYRMFFSTVIMLPLVFWKCRDELRSVTAHDVLWCSVSGIMLALHFYVFFMSLDYTSVASALVLVDTSVFFVAIIMLALFRETISKLGWGAMLLTFFGSIVISLGDFGGSALLGDVLATLGALFFSFYAVIGRRERSHMSTLSYTFIVYTASTVTAFIISLIDGNSVFEVTGHGMLCALGIAVFCTLLGHSIVSLGLKYEKASFIAVTNLLEPVFGSIMALFLFSEVPAPTVLIGSAIILVGVYLFSRYTAPDEAKDDRGPKIQHNGGKPSHTDA